jgi:hypothetical protein
MLWNLASVISHVSLHSGEPNAANELRGGVYRRMQINFRDPIDGVIRSEREVSFEVPAGAHVTHAGFWTSSIGGTLLAWDESREHAYRGRGTYIVDLARLDLNCEAVS